MSDRRLLTVQARGEVRLDGARRTEPRETPEEERDRRHARRDRSA